MRKSPISEPSEQNGVFDTNPSHNILALKHILCPSGAISVTQDKLSTSTAELSWQMFLPKKARLVFCDCDLLISWRTTRASTDAVLKTPVFLMLVKLRQQVEKYYSWTKPLLNKRSTTSNKYTLARWITQQNTNLCSIARWNLIMFHLKSFCYSIARLICVTRAEMQQLRPVNIILFMCDS